MKTINSPVTVSAIGFLRGTEVYPRRIEFGGCSYQFIDPGLRTVVRRGERLSKIFTMTDGVQQFCLRKDGALWTLIGIFG